ncbi:sulfate transport system permease protein [Ruminiclostridium sufflavum DSM 19573]|uniref:Sulfate transport system permease protein CysT n=1 Tax=Ruminiclostridium sufflavum DSM 19573 TaxID=1121337 RepID=A0A318XHL3_9FIRM|nr:sulfate ABC transporter permease subunit CysT [Ruminiclostridium sufflavum]PYG84853.1 sulfate transport system permease protein [Ruminiclostridium sufflavum DSM 19573]
MDTILKNLKNFTAKRKVGVIPGFGLSIGITITLISFIVVIPLLSVLVAISGFTWKEFWDCITDKMVLHAYQVSFVCSFIAALINCVFGLILAWVLTRYKFPGRRLLDGLIELPFALPTAVAGIALTTIYADQGWIGSLFKPLGVKISYTLIGITIALIFIGIPFVVRSVQPVLEKLDSQYEEAAEMLGASRLRTFFKVIFPEILPALLTGFGLAFSRGLGEYGSVVFIAGNIPYKTQIAPLIIMGKLEQFSYAGATAIALVMIVFAFILLFAINFIQGRMNKAAKNS